MRQAKNDAKKESAKKNSCMYVVYMHIVWHVMPCHTMPCHTILWYGEYWFHQESIEIYFNETLDFCGLNVIVRIFERKIINASSYNRWLSIIMWWVAQQNDDNDDDKTMMMTKAVIFSNPNSNIKRCCILQAFILLIQYKNYFLAWDARLSDKSDFETVYFVFRLRILKQNENSKSSQINCLTIIQFIIQIEQLNRRYCSILRMFLIDNYSYFMLWHEFMSEHEIIANTSFISIVDIVVEQSWKYFAIQISMKNDMKIC